MLLLLESGIRVRTADIKATPRVEYCSRLPHIMFPDAPLTDPEQTDPTLTEPELTAVVILSFQ